MTVGSSSLPGLFGMPQRKKPVDIKPQPPGTNKVFFMGQDFNQAVAFLESIGLESKRSWNCIHNKAGVEGVNHALIYICPGAENHPHYQDIIDYLWQQPHNRMIFLTEVHAGASS